MAAQKLTRGRFVQIIIMLTVLIVAFIWRTLEHEPTIELTCSVDETCTFYVNNSLFVAHLNDQKLTLETDDSGWKVAVTDNIKLKAEKNSKWVFNAHQETTEISFKLYKLNETMAAKVTISGK